MGLRHESFGKYEYLGQPREFEADDISVEVYSAFDLPLGRCAVVDANMWHRGEITAAVPVCLERI